MRIVGAHRARPNASSAGTMTRLGASRMSSVLGLKVRPKTATVFPRSEPPHAATTLVGHRTLARVVDPDHRPRRS